jgi:hypothetical protein
MRFVRHAMAQDEFNPQPGRIRDARRARAQRHAALVFRQAGKHGARALRQRGHISSATPKRGMGAGARAAAGLMAPGSRRVIVKARYTRIVGGDLGAARAHMKYIVRDGVTREGAPGRLYDANGDDADGSAFLDRCETDPHQFRFVVSADEGTRLADLKPFIRDLLSQMERDLDTKLDWVAVDHFNTGHPHTHIVIRGRDVNGEELVMARDYVSHGVRGRAQALITLELGPETEVERVQKLFNEVGQERLTRLDRSLIAGAKDGILVVSAEAGEAQRKAIPIRAIGIALGTPKLSARQSLEALLEHWAVVHRQQGFADVNSVVRINTDQVGVEGCMMQFRKRQSVGHNGLAEFGVDIGHDMSGVEEARLGQTRQRAATLVGGQYGFPEGGLMQPLAHHPQAISALTYGRKVGVYVDLCWDSEREPRLELGCRPLGNVGRPDRHPTLRRDAQEVEDRGLLVAGFAKPSVVSCLGVVTHESVIDQLTAAVDLLVDFPLIVVPDLPAASRKHRLDAQQVAHDVAAPAAHSPPGCSA